MKLKMIMNWFDSIFMQKKNDGCKWKWWWCKRWKLLATDYIYWKKTSVVINGSGDHEKKDCCFSL